MAASLSAEARWREGARGAAAAALALFLGAVPAPAATPPDTIIMARSIDDIVSLDPAEAYEVSGGEVIGNVYDRLIENDPAAPGRFRPGLAANWSADEDGRHFQFRLRSGVRFASGHPVTAADAAFSLRRAVLLDRAPALILRQLGLTRDNVRERVRAVDATTLTIETGAALPAALAYACLAAPVGSVVDEQAAMAHAEEGDFGAHWLATHGAGSGAYRLVTWQPGERYVLAADAEYWGGAPANRRVIVRHVKDGVTQRLMLMRGDIDYARDLDRDQLDGLAHEPGLRFDRRVQSLITYLALNQKNPYLGRPEIVAAIKVLVDYDGIGRLLLGPTAIAHQAFEPEGLPGAISDTPFRFDPAHAKALLASAGLAEGFTVSIDVRNASPWTEVAQALQADFATAGIRLTIIPGDGKQVLTKYRARHHDIFLGEWAPDYADPNSNAEAFAANDDNSDDASRKTPAWRSAWSDAAMNAAVAAAATERDPTRRAALYEALQRSHQQVAPFVFLFERIEVAAHPVSVDGFVLGFTPSDDRYARIAKH